MCIFMNMKNYILKSKTNEELIETLNNSKSMWDFAKKLGYTNKSGNTYKYLYKTLSERGIKIKDCEYRNTGRGKRKTDEEVFCENSTYGNRELKKRIIAQNPGIYKCATCGITDWNGATISLQLDHINGINNDNRRENLRFLCPNCHTQTETWGINNSGKRS